jgi:NAD+ diphosphatase
LLFRSMMDRVAIRRRDDGWLDTAWKAARLLVVDGRGQALVADGPVGPALVLSGTDGDRPADAVLLGELAGLVHFARRGELVPAAETRPASLREVGAELSDADAGLLVAAVAVLNWHDVHSHSPRTGAATRAIEAGWAREATDGSGQLWPRTDPAVIVLITDGVAGPGGRCLLGRQPRWPPQRYSCIAGFVEPGESLEAAVIREVGEEVGLRPRKVSYVASQPWPFPASLMIGFRAVAPADGPVVRLDEELEDARWFSRTDLRAGAVRLPPPTSIAHHLITSWLAGD